MAGVCCGETTNKTLDEGCKIVRSPTSHEDRHKRTMYRCGVLQHEDFHQPLFHHDCPENQIRSLVGRVAGPTPKPTKLGLRLLKQAIDNINHLIPRTTANDLDDMPKRYSGGKRMRYERAAEDLKTQGICKGDSSVKFFIKAERFNPAAKVNPDPRAIQFRGARYCVALAAFLHPIEHYLYESNWFSKGVLPSRNIAKGLNSVARAELLVEKASRFERPVFIGLDASRFDKHVSKELLEIEHSVYKISNPDRFFAKLLSWQLHNKGFSNLGLVYKLVGRRMSGDMNTALGNCLLMCIMLLAYAIYLMLSRWDCLDDGDDVVLIVEHDDHQRIVDGVKDFFLNFGMQMKVESIAYSVHEVVFCQSSIVEFRPGKYKFVRNYAAVMSKGLVGIRNWSSEVYRRKVIHSVGLCELVLNLGVPVLQEWALALLRNVPMSGGVDLSVAPEGLQARVKRELQLLGIKLEQATAQPILPCARDSFAIAFGLSVTEQIELERRLANWTFTTDGSYYVGEELDVPSWTHLPSWNEVYDPVRL